VVVPVAETIGRERLRIGDRCTETRIVSARG